MITATIQGRPAEPLSVAIERTLREHLATQSNVVTSGDCLKHVIHITRWLAPGEIFKTLMIKLPNHLAVAKGLV